MCIQEINIFSARKFFCWKYQVFVNFDITAKTNIGIVTLVDKDLKVIDTIIGNYGRIIGIKVNNIQVWNIYPLSGTGYKKEREIFFKETLCNYMMVWKDHTKYIIQAGDHNCTHRIKASLHNPEQHLQQGLIKHMKVNGTSRKINW